MRPFSGKGGGSAGHSLPTLMTRVLCYMTTRSCTFSDSLSHKTPPPTTNQPPLFPHQKKFLLLPTQSKSSVLNPSAHRMGWSGRVVDLVSWGLCSMSKCMFHHQKTTVATRDPPSSSLPFKLNNHPNRALEISTNISTKSQTSITQTRTYQVGLSSQRRPWKGPQSQATRETQSLLADSFVHLKQQIHPLPVSVPAHSAFLHGIVLSSEADLSTVHQDATVQV